MIAVFMGQAVLPARAHTPDMDELTLAEVMSDYVTADVNLGITAKAAVLMEAETMTVIYEQAADEILSPASITKIMTLILIFDAIESGKITLQDEVRTSAHAKSMGGSQVFLEEGEVQTVETMIKCIVVASGNDASVAMAEHLCGSEAEFVRQMNERAKGLGMTNTNFEDCCGLTESDNHYTSARDVALMSRELITKYPQIKNYSTIWMENITHVTAQGTKEFGLANTNKLLKQYEWCTGLKTGSTSKAKYCLSATADKNGVELIAVIMAAPDYKVRFSEALTLLNYGYGLCKLYKDDNTDILPDISVNGGVEQGVSVEYESSFSYLDTEGKDLSGITKEIALPENGVTAPVKAGDIIGTAKYYLGDTLIGEVNIVAKTDVEKAGFFDYFKKTLDKFAL
ncbi:MAG: D-alanyl-D-alanine carboxypeptidase [Lachnospiraceae bacterium]|nr:D-alanyl-D-alanine carboxypeptidase [Lachnospiraceae bacterium]